MAIVLQEMVTYLNQYLQVGKFKDYCPNGLQVEGKGTIKKIVTGVTACQQLIDAAIEAKADAIIVHHGYFWKGEDECITGIKKQRLQALLKHDISLLAYHLPLDCHLEVGNNIQLAQVLGFSVEGTLSGEGTTALGHVGRLHKPMSVQAFNAWLAECLQREPMHIGESNDTIETIAWCTGAAQSYLQQAVDLSVDAFLSGEISEPTVHLARETGTHYFSAGHHATERYGVKALGDRLAQEFDIDVEFIDIDNPV